jgi:glycosyltransferase involved in cell wall biosynthesis
MGRLDPHIRLLSHPKNKGYGAAVKTGLKNCRKDWIFFTDSDGQFHYDELLRFVEATASADLIMGYRKKRMDPFHRVFVAQVLLKIWNFVLFGLTVRDVDCAYKLFPRSLRDQIKLRSESAITVTEFIIKAKLTGARIKQLPVTHYPRRFGEQTGGNWRVILRAARESFAVYKELNS